MAANQPRQEVITLPLGPSLRTKLLDAGFRTVADFEHVRALDLAAEAGLTPEEALQVLKLTCRTARSDGSIAGVACALDLHARELCTPKVITFCPALDKVLGGGVHAGQVTEFCGVPAVGKTQLGIQLCVDVQIPTAFGGVHGAAVYIDTEGSVMSDRVVEIASAAVAHMRKIAASSSSPAKQAAAAALSVDAILSNIHYFRCRDSAELQAAVATLPHFLAAHPQVKLVVVDSIAFHFRHEFEGDMGRRARVLAGLGMSLQALAGQHDAAVVLMNQVTSQVAGDRGGQPSKLVPALGDSWAHAATTRVILYWEAGRRMAYVYKSPYLPPGTAEYLVTAEGVRGHRPKRKHPADGGGADGGAAHAPQPHPAQR